MKRLCLIRHLGAAPGRVRPHAAAAPASAPSALFTSHQHYSSTTAHVNCRPSYTRYCCTFDLQTSSCEPSHGSPVNITIHHHSSSTILTNACHGQSYVNSYTPTQALSYKGHLERARGQPVGNADCLQGQGGCACWKAHPGSAHIRVDTVYLLMTRVCNIRGDCAQAARLPSTLNERCPGDAVHEAGLGLGFGAPGRSWWAAG